MKAAETERFDTLMNTIGSKITELRKAKTITQDQLAEAMGVSPQAVSKWENDLSCPDITLLPQLADYFHVTIDELLRGNRSSAIQMLPEDERKDLNRILLRINVDSSSGDIVKVNLPLSLVKMGLEMSMQLPQLAGNEALKDVDFRSILLAAENGVIGKLVEVKTAQGDDVSITIE